MKKEVTLQKKILSVLLSTSLVFGGVDMTAFASETVEKETQIQTQTVEETECETRIETEQETEQNTEKDSEQESKVEQETQVTESETEDTLQSSEAETEKTEQGIDTEVETKEIEVSEEKVSDEEELNTTAITGTCGDNLTWNFDENTGTLTITGNGDMYNYEYSSSVPWELYKSSITNIIFEGDSNEEGLTSIGDFAFYECSGLTGELGLPPSLTNIGDNAFYKCSGITGRLELPSGLTNIGNNAFADCSGITGRLELPSGLTNISVNAFSGCSGITELELPSDLTSIGGYAFSGCSGITELELPSGLTSIDGSAFINCSGITELKLPSSLTSMGSCAFSGCSGITELELPSGLTNISLLAFSGCSGITELKLPSGLTSIGSMAFYKCSGIIGRLELPSGLTSIGSSAFAGCSGLTGYICIPETVKTMDSLCFSGCYNLKRDVYIQSTDVDFGRGSSQFSFNSYEYITIHAPKGSTAEKLAWESKYYTFEEWDGVTLPDDFYDDDQRELTYNNIPNDEYWILVTNDGEPLDAATYEILDSKEEYISLVDTNKDESLKKGIDYIWSQEHSAIIVKNAHKHNVLSIQIQCPVYDYIPPRKEYEVVGGKCDYYVTYINTQSIAQVLTEISVKGFDSRVKDLVAEKATFYKKNFDGSVNNTINKLQISVANQNEKMKPDKYQLIELVEKTVDGKTVLEENVKKASAANTIEYNLSTLSEDSAGVIIRALQGDKTLCDAMLHLKVREKDPGVIDETEDIKLGTETEFTIGDNIPFIGGGTFNIDIGETLPVSKVLDIVNNKAGTNIDEFLIGKEEKNGIEHYYIALGRKISDEDNPSSYLKELQKNIDRSKKGCSFGGFEVEYSMQGMIDAYQDSNGDYNLDLTVSVKVTGSDGVVWYYPTFPVYVFIDGELTGEAEVNGVHIALGKDIGQIPIELTVAAALTLGAGLGIKDVVNAEVSGTGKFEIALKKKASSDPFIVKFILNAGVSAQFLVFKYEKSFAEYEEQLYPNKPESSNAIAYASFAAELHKESNYELIGDSYLLEADSASELMVYAAETDNNRTPKSIIINGVYPDANPQYINYNGTDYLFYLDADTTRSLTDRTTLMYRINTGSGWGQAYKVSDDGTADFDYDVVVGKDGIYAVWQNAGKTLEGMTEMKDVVEALGLSAAKIDGADVTLLDMPQCEYAPIEVALYADDDDIWAGWYENSEYDMLNNNNGKNLLYAVKLGDSTPTAQKLGETSDGICSFDIGRLDGELCMAVTADTDGRLDTMEDRNICLFRNGSQEKITENDILDSNAQFVTLNGKDSLVYYSDNNYWYTDGNAAKKILPDKYQAETDDYKIACDGENAVLIWHSTYRNVEDAGKAIAMTAYRNGAWTAPANVAEIGESLNQYTVKAAQNSTARLYYTTCDRNGSKDITRLCEVEAKEIGSVQFSDFNYEEDDYEPGSAFPIGLKLYNNGTCALDECSIMITNAAGEAVYTKSDIAEPEVGAETDVQISDFVPADHGDLAEYIIKLVCGGRVYDIHSIWLGGASISFDYSMGYDRWDEVVNAHISNHSKMTDSFRLTVVGMQSGEILLEQDFENIEAEHSANYMFNLTEMWKKTKDNAIILRAESTKRKERYTLGNEHIIYNDDRTKDNAYVSLDKTELTLKVGETKQLTATVTPDTAPDKSLTWTSNDEQCVAVDGNGTLTALQPGLAKIKVVTVDDNVDFCMVNVFDETDFPVIGNTHTIAYYDGAQQITMEPSAFKEGEAILLLAPYKAGYDFAGWYETQDFSGSVVEWIPEGTTTDKVFYAKWAERVREKNDAKTETSLSVEFAGTGIYTYTGAAIKPEVIVRDEGQILQQGRDYTVSYKNNTQAATAVSEMAQQCIAPYVDSEKAPMVLITGKGNYKGKKAAAMNFTIKAKELSDASVMLASDDSMASKSAKGGYADQQLAAVLKDGKKSLNKAKDYIITYDYLGEDGSRTSAGADKDMTAVNKPGAYTVHISARIVKDSSGRMIRSSAKNNVSNANYTGSLEPFTLYVQDSAKILSKAKITPANTKGIQQGTANITVEQVIKSITFGSGKNAEVYETDTAEKKVAFTEKFDVTGLDTLTAKAGTGYVTVTAKAGSGYFGSRRIAVKILGTPLSKAVFTQTGNSTAFTYNGTVQAPAYTLQTSGTSPATLTEGKDYTITYQKEKTTVLSPVAAGSYTATYTGIGAYTGTVKKTFKIAPLDLAAAYKADKNAITVTASSAPYNPKGAVPAEVTVAYTPAGGTALTLAAEDYTIICSQNKAIGKGSITLNAKGNYKGTIKNIMTYDIVAKSMASDDITVEVEDVFYKAGADIAPKLTVYDNGVKVNAKDYTVAFADGSAKLTGYQLPEGAEYADIDLTVTANAGKNYTEGTKASAKLHIYTKKISSAEVVLKPNGTDNQYYYTGQQIKPVLQSVTYQESKNAEKITLTNSETEGYLVKYGTNTKTGSANVTIYGTGKYGGSKTVKFIIYPKWMKWMFG